jgi:solute carrier family 35 protein F1/2
MLSGPSVTTLEDTMSHQSLDSKRDFAQDHNGTSVHSIAPREAVRPPILYYSFNAFMISLWWRWKSIWTKRFTLSLLAGQVVSLCITITTVTTTELVSRNWSLPTTQTWFLCVSCVDAIIHDAHSFPQILLSFHSLYPLHCVSV